MAALAAVAVVLLALWRLAVVDVVRRREPGGLRALALFAGPAIGVVAAVPLLHGGFQAKYPSSTRGRRC